MGVALLLSIGACFLLGALISFSSWMGWQTGLKVELGLLVFTGLLGLGFVLQRVGSKKSSALPEWSLLLSGLGLGLAALSFLLGEGPGRYPVAVDRSIDLPAWTVAGGGVAAAIIALVFGAVATRQGGVVRAATGLVFCCAGLLLLQPALAAAGQPTVGPLGLGVAVAAALAYRFTRPS